MKSRNIIFSAIGLLMIGGLSSCSDFLDADNKSNGSADEQFSNKEGVSTLLNQAYFTMREVYSSPFIFSSGTDLYMPMRNSRGSETLERYSLTSDDAEVTALYTNLYNVVNSANCVIYYAGQAGEFADKATWVDEARFVRAYAYYILTQQFGGVPLIKDYIQSAATSYPRTALAEVYSFLVDELKALSGAESALVATDHTGHANKLAAKALLAKVYLAQAWDLDTALTDAAQGTYTINSTANFQLAATTAAEVCGAVPLTMTFADKWSPANENNNEILFSIQYDRATSLNQVDGGHSQQHNFGTYLGANTLGVKGMGNGLCPTAKTFYLYEKGDTRYEGTFMTTIYNYKDAWDKEGYFAYYNVPASNLASLPVSFYFPAWYTTDAEIADYQAAHASQFVTTGYKNVSQIIRSANDARWIIYKADGTVGSDATYTFTEASGKVGAFPPIRKFDDAQTTSEIKQSNGSYRDIVVLNASEIYLVAAEAYLLANDKPEALKYLNKVRERAGASQLADFASYRRFDPDENVYVAAAQDIDVILDERARELLGEFYRWMDLRRTRQLVRYNIQWNADVTGTSSMAGVGGEIKWLRPIPSNEMGMNTGISIEDQNPGYAAVDGEEAE